MPNQADVIRGMIKRSLSQLVGKYEHQGVPLIEDIEALVVEHWQTMMEGTKVEVRALPSKDPSVIEFEVLLTPPYYFEFTLDTER